MTKTCNVCRRRPAVEQVKTSGGRKQWRCAVCLALQNPSGFTKGKQ